MEFAKNYLTSEEIEVIIHEMSLKDNEIERMVLKYALVAQLTIKDLGEYENCNAIFDDLAKNEMLDEIELKVRNFYMIDEIIAKQNSVSNVVAEFLAEISAKIDEYSKNLNAEEMTNIVNQLKQAVVKEEVDK